MFRPSGNKKVSFDKLRKFDPNLKINWDEKIGVPLRVRGNLSAPRAGDPETVSLQFLDENKRLFDINSSSEELQLKDISVDAEGNRHVRFQQKYKNLPVFGAELIVHINRENIVKGINGKFTPHIDLPDTPKIPFEKAREIIIGDDPNNKERIDEMPRLLIFIDAEKKPHLAWHMSVDGTDTELDGSETPAKWEYFVDGLTGKIVWRYNNEQTHGRTTGTGTGKYSGIVTLNTQHNHTSNKYELQDDWLPTTAKVITHDANNGYPPSPVSEDNNNNWSATDQDAEVDCHLYTRMVYDYFLLVHGRDSYDDAGADLHIYAHCGTNWNNASWNGSYVKIGDGDGVDKDPYCTLDIIAHEWTHAVTEHTAGLIYYGESGALNESMSDVFAALIDGDWLQGEDNWLKATAPAGRNLEDPTNGGQYDPANPISSVLDGHQPDHMNDKYTGTADNAGVHINSGIMNKAAYLISTGGTHRGITICTGLGRDVLGRIYYHALTQYLTSSSDFSDMKDAVLDSLDDLYAGDPKYARWQASIINAFAAVGIGSSVVCPAICWIAPGVCPPSPYILCPPAPKITCYLAPALRCPPSPQVIECPPSPYILCPPAPRFICPPAPRGCLPGPDPGPFMPEIITRVKPSPKKDIDVIEVAGIGPEYASLLKSIDVSTAGELVKATRSEEAIKDLAKTLNISEKRLRGWRDMADHLTR